MHLTEAITKATAIGTDHGSSAGTWVAFDSWQDAYAYLQGVELELWPDAPLSGEWADSYSVRELVADCGLELDESDPDSNEVESELASAYEEAYYAAWRTEVERTASAMLPPNPEGTGPLQGRMVEDSTRAGVAIFVDADYGHGYPLEGHYVGDDSTLTLDRWHLLLITDPEDVCTCGQLGCAWS